VRRREGHAELIRGTAVCTVKPAPRGQRRGPVKVFVSHGVIEVTGTVFHLSQGPRGGRVTLQRGAIRFIASEDGRSVALTPGQTLSWPLARQAAGAGKAGGDASGIAPGDAGHGPGTGPGTGPAAAVKPRRPPPLSPADAESLLERVARLRDQRRFVEAAAALQRGLPRVRDRGTRETFSYELGSILTHHLDDRGRACRHWRRHLRRYGAARYGHEINGALRKLSCP
jgi:hypothetical protein